MVSLAFRRSPVRKWEPALGVWEKHHRLVVPEREAGRSGWDSPVLQRGTERAGQVLAALPCAWSQPMASV